MNPWSILGWILVAAVVMMFVPFVAILIRSIATGVERYWLHLKTRNIPPAEGQVWKQGNNSLTIEKKHSNGMISIASGISGWGETEETWKKRVRNRRLYLIKK